MTIDASYIASFEAYLNQKKCSPLTLEAYRRDVREFFAFKPKGPTLVQQEDGNEWIQKLQSDGATSKTINRKITSLRTFLKHLRYLGKMEKNPLENLILPKSESAERIPLTDAQWSAMLAVPAETFQDRVDRLVVAIFFSSGCRRAELAVALRSQLDPERRILRTIGKGRKKRKLVLTPKTMALYADHVAEVPATATHIVSDENGEPWGYERIYLSVKRVGKKAGVAVYPHLLRHTLATAMLRNGKDIRKVQEVLGHNSISTTEKYTHLLDEDLTDFHDSFHPDNMPKKSASPSSPQQQP